MADRPWKTLGLFLDETLFRLKIHSSDINFFFSGVHGVQKWIISNLKCNIKANAHSGVKIMQVKAIKAISSAAADNLISLFLLEMHLE